MVMPNSFRFSIDCGGIFTDIYAEVSGEPEFKTLKILSENTQQYPDAPLEGIRQIIHEVTGKPSIPNVLIEWVRLGTTLANNAFLERKGTKRNEKCSPYYKRFWRFAQNRNTKPASYF
jgi:5-oxoprolinase (ATP-hydrolysing)